METHLICPDQVVFSPEIYYKDNILNSNILKMRNLVHNSNREDFFVLETEMNWKLIFSATSWTDEQGINNLSLSYKRARSSVHTPQKMTALRLPLHIFQKERNTPSAPQIRSALP